MATKEHLNKQDRKKAKEFRKNRRNKRDRWNTGESK